MSTRLDEAVAHIKTLPEDDQERAAAALLAFADERSSYDYSFSEAQLAGIDHAMRQADRGAFASDNDVREMFGRLL